MAPISRFRSIPDILLQSPTAMFVRKGEVDEIVRPGARHEVRTAIAVVGAIGTNLDVATVGSATVVTVVRGAVRVKTKHGVIVVKTNQQITVRPRLPPTRPRSVHARRMVSWTRDLPPGLLGDNIALDVSGGRIVGYSSVVGQFGRYSGAGDAFIVKLSR